MDIVWVNQSEWNEIKELPAAARKGVLFLPLALRDAMTNPNELNLIYGSRFSAKTETEQRYSLWQILQPDYQRIAFARKTQKQARDLMFQKYIDLINDENLGWKNEFDVHDTKMRITSKRTGHHIFGTSFENSDNIMGVSNITKLHIDEPLAWNGNINLKDFENISESLRNDKGIPPIITLTTNPISKETFIYKDIANPDTRTFDNVKVTNVNFQDNPFCPDDAIRKLNSLKLRDYERYRVNGLGEWGVIKADNPFFFNADKINIRPVKWRDDVLTIFAFDFNLDIMSCGVIQFNPQTKVIAVLSEFEPCTGVSQRIRTIRASKYFNPDKPYMYEITGDFDGVKRGRVDGQITSYNQIEDGLGMQPIQTKISPNISHYDSRHLCANIFSTWTVYIDPSCTRLIADLKATPTTKDGKIDKRKYDPHYADFLRYFIQNYCK